MLSIIQNTTKHPDAQAQLCEMIQNQQDIYIFGGLGEMSLGSVNASFLEKKGIDIKGFIANKKYITKDTYRSKPVFAIEETSIDRNSNIVVGISNWVCAKEELEKYQFKNIFIFDAFIDQYLESIDMQYFQNYQKNFEQTYQLLEDELSKRTMIAYLQGKIFHNFEGLASTYYKGGGAYFNDMLKFLEGDIMIDCGAFDGDTALAFAKTCPKYKKIYALEPNKKIFNSLQSRTKDLNIITLNCGAYSKQTTLSFQSYDSGCSRVVSNSDNTISVDTIDHIIENEKSPISFIKMDIEGSELEAIKGGTTCIKKYKPKLAICVYHKRNDLIDIPKEILKIRPDYKIFLRNHQCIPEDTVLYAL